MSDVGLPGGAPPPPPAPVAQAGYGNLGKRFLARLIDGLLVGIPLSIILTVLPGISASGVVGNAVIGAASFGYFIFLETSKGATFGKQWLGMSVAGEAGAPGPISMDASVRRNAWMLLSLLGGIPLLGLIASLASLALVILIATTISSSPRNQGWHDKLASTVVLDRPAALPPAAAA